MEFLNVDGDLIFGNGKKNKAFFSFVKFIPFGSSAKYRNIRVKSSHFQMFKRLLARSRTLLLTVTIHTTILLSLSLTAC